ncbi:hypothetical protein D3C75_1082690 [compost metagenome]
MEQLPAVAQAQHNSSLHKFPLPQAEHLSPHHPGKPRPIHNAEHQHDDIHPVVCRNLPFREQRPEDKQQRQAGYRHQQVGDPHNNLICYAAVITGNRPQQSANEHGQHHGSQTYSQ